MNYVIFLFLFVNLQISSSCPNSCNSNGICTNGSLQLCSCFPGFHGVDCSIRLCPAGIAWVDFPNADNSAHSDYTQCSNMGNCNTLTGLCECRFGFSGPACDMMLCPLGNAPTSHMAVGGGYLPCNGNGRCVSLREVSNHPDFVHFTNKSTNSGWEVDMIQGCACDSGWEGFDCSRQSCPKGDDPLTAGVNEIQLIDCTCQSCTGGVYFTFKDQRTSFISFNASEEVISYRLNQISTVEKVVVTIKKGKVLCQPDGSATAVEFFLPHGRQSALQVTVIQDLALDGVISIKSNGATSDTAPYLVSVSGTKEHVTCSNHGLCNNGTGTCECFGGFSSSNGFGDVGTRGDCGHRVAEYVYYSANITTGYNTSCPFYYNAVCSGHGSCDTETDTCVCDKGYGGLACQGKTCPLTSTWFGDVGSNHTGVSECGNVGECDILTGTCSRCGGEWSYYGGDACQYLTCQRDENGNMCSGKGYCMSLRNLGMHRYNSQKSPSKVVYDTPWDADKIYGCMCSRPISIDNVFSSKDYLTQFSNKFLNMTTTNLTYFDDDMETFRTNVYRGPYAYAVTENNGFDCSTSLCPTGDNPMTTGELNEIQEIQFSSSTGVFYLSFRGNTTYSIFCNATIDILEYRLEQLFTIHDVKLSRSGNSSTNICDTASPIYVEFVSEFGDLPLMMANETGMAAYNSVIVSEYQKGSKEDIECSGQGICNEKSGVCQCLERFSSSNGYFDSPGERGDCTFMNPYYTVKYAESSYTGGSTEVDAAEANDMIDYFDFTSSFIQDDEFEPVWYD